MEDEEDEGGVAVRKTRGREVGGEKDGGGAGARRRRTRWGGGGEQKEDDIKLYVRGNAKK